MIVEFSIENYRSIKEKQTFSMVAEATKYKRDTNTANIPIGKDDNIQLLKSAVIYGANASGKSSFLRAFGTFKTLIISAGRLPEGNANKLYTPFLFDVDSQQKDTSFECVFIFKNIKHQYAISYNGYRITKEELNYYPRNVKKKLFTRIINEKDELADDIRVAKDVKEIDLKLFPEHFKVFKNQVILSKFGSDIPDKFFNDIHRYFLISWRVWTNNNSQGIELLSDAFISSFGTSDLSDDFFKKLESLIKAVDVKIDGLEVKEEAENSSADNEKHFRTLTQKNEQPKKQLFGRHSVYKNNEVLYTHHLPFKEESAGTNVLFALGAYIILVIENGGTIVFDELDNSLHPKVARFLISLFNNTTINKRNAQIIFSTHEAHLLDRDMFRSDQIWFADKNREGETEIYSAQDFKEIREDIPFDKWYLAGKFGALPDIKDIEDIFKK